MKKTTRVAAKLLAGAAVAAAFVVGSMAPTTASAHDTGWFSVTAGHANQTVQPNADTGWF